MALNEYGPLRRVAMRHARDAFHSRDAVERQWRTLGYHGRPDFDAAVREYDRLVELIAGSDAEIEFLPGDGDLTLDSIYLRDAALLAPRGAVLCHMGRASRGAEPELAGRAFAALGIPVVDAVSGAGRVEGGDFVWLDPATCVLGLTYRSNDEGARQLRQIFGPEVELRSVDLPHYKGPDDVFHLMSILSPLDRDLALVHAPLMPIGFRRWLLDRGMTLVEVADGEFEAMACNVLALAPRRCLAIEGCPETRRRLEAAGCEVLTYQGDEISRRGDGGPTCLTRPLQRD